MKNARSGGMIKKYVNIYNNKMLLFSHICSSIYNTPLFFRKNLENEKKKISSRPKPFFANFLHMFLTLKTDHGDKGHIS